MTHLSSITQDAEASAGSIKVLQQEAVLALWDRVRLALSLYRDNWSLHNIPARINAAQMIRSRLPTTGWLVRALDVDTRFISPGQMVTEWPQN